MAELAQLVERLFCKHQVIRSRRIFGIFFLKKYIDVNKVLLSDDIWNKIYCNQLKAISVNALQRMQFDDLVTLLQKMLPQKSDVSKKSDVVNLIVRYVIKNGYKVCGTGLVDIINTDNYGFIRSYENHYFPNNDDIFIHGKKIRQYNIRQSDLVAYMITDVSDSDKRLSINSIVSIHGTAADKFTKYRTVFEDLVPCYPNKKIDIANSVGKAKRFRCCDT